MGVKPGYKLTEVGEIPKDWEVRRFFDAVAISSGQVDPTKEPYRSMILVAPDHIESGTGRIISHRTAAEQGAISGKYQFESGDVIYSKIRPYLQKAALAGFPGICSADMYALRPRDGMSGRYLLAVLLGRQFTSYAVSVSVRSGMPKINRTELAEFSIPVPTTGEQGAIDRALSAVDELLNCLERIVVKKRDLKQAAMQQLLTGRTRLPGFQGEWEVKRLGDLGPLIKGSGVRKDEARSGDLPCVRYGEIYTHHSDCIREFHSWISPNVAKSATRLRRGDLLFAGSGETKAEIGKCVAFVGDEEAYAGGDIVILRACEGDPLFLGYLLNAPSVAAQKASLGQGDAVVHIGANALASVVVSLPGAAEQRAIATVLSDMDAEIAALDARRDKTLALKQAMMQELLTGRTRLV